MSYDIFIGEAELSKDSGSMHVRVNRIDEHPEAPSFPNDEMTGRGNHRHPGYTAWSEFCQMTDLYALFFAENEGLMCEHPGCFRLTQAHHQIIAGALDRWQTEHPGAVPGFEGWVLPGRPAAPPTGNDPILACLLWLEWWVRWALTNCTNPAIYNF